jgi:fermentation-respiration switch protein FrsA (DUF1100 family)
VDRPLGPSVGTAVSGLVTRIVVGVVAVAVVGAVGFIVNFRLHDESAVIEADRVDHGPPPASLGLPVAPISLTASDGVRLAAWQIPPDRTEGAPFWVIHFHGNASNLTTPGYAESYAALHRLGLGVLAVEYRGFGKSEGTVGEAGLYRDAEAGYRYLTDTLKIPPERIVLYGFSLGSGVATELATVEPVAGLILEGAYTSIRDSAQESHPLVPIPLFLADRLNTLARIASVSAPKLFIHATNDTTVPISHGRALFAAALGKKTFLEVPGEHATAYKTDAKTFYDGIATFLASLPKGG